MEWYWNNTHMEIAFFFAIAAVQLLRLIVAETWTLTPDLSPLPPFLPLSPPASGSFVRDRPMSSLGCLSQATLPQSSSHADTTSELLQQDLELHVDLSQLEEEPIIIL